MIKWTESSILGEIIPVAKGVFLVLSHRRRILHSLLSNANINIFHMKRVRIHGYWCIGVILSGVKCKEGVYNSNTAHLYCVEFLWFLPSSPVM